LIYVAYSDRESIQDLYTHLLFFFQNFIQDGVILGADTRATEGPIVCDKNCEKIHYMAPNIYCCGAGTAADTEAVTGICCGCLKW
jgi:hypothetical protein